MRLWIGTDQLEIRFVDQGRGLKSVSRPLTGESLGGQPTQFVIHERQELLRGGRVSFFDGG